MNAANLRGADLRKLHVTVVKHRHQELADVLGVVASGPPTHAPSPAQMLIERGEDVLQSQ